MKLLLFILFIFTNLLFSDALTLARTIQNKEFPLSYFYWFDEKEKAYYLSKEQSDNNYSVWQFTKDRKWKPYHNTSKFDGFPKAGKVLVSANRENTSMKIKKEYCKEDNSNKRACQEMSYDISHYFWLDTTGLAFLLSKNQENISIWRLTQDKKWQPVHNAQAFDGYPKAEKNIETIELNIGKSVIKIGKAVSEISKNFHLNLESENLGNSNSLTATFLELSPQLSWAFNQKYKDVVSNFVYQIKTDDGTLVYSTVFKENETSAKVARGSIYKGILPRGYFCETSFTKYKKPKPEKTGEEAGDKLPKALEGDAVGYTVGYNLSLYPIPKLSHILDNPNCTNLVSKPEYHITKHTINATLFTDSTVQVNGEFNEDTSDDKRGIFHGEVIFKFFPTNINRLPIDYNDYLTIGTLPPGLTPVFESINDDSIKLYMTGMATRHEGASMRVKVTFNKNMFVDKLDREQTAYFTMNFAHGCGQ